MTTPVVPLYTLGYGARSLDEFVELLNCHRIGYLIDVRSSPYSRFKPEFSKEALAREIAQHNVRYLYMGNVLGGRPDDSSCYQDGKVDYETIKTKEWYQQGLERLVRAFEQQLRVVIMCSEGKPEHCHRSKLLK